MTMSQGDTMLQGDVSTRRTRPSIKEAMDKVDVDFAAETATAVETASGAIEEAIAGFSPVTVIENNRLLERTATADSAVNVVLHQLNLSHPTLLSAWTKLEIARLLHMLYAEPGGEIRLGDQTLGQGFGPMAPSPKNEDGAFNQD